MFARSLTLPLACILTVALAPPARAETLDFETAARLAAEQSLDSASADLTVSRGEIDQQAAKWAWTPTVALRSSAQGSLGRTFSEQLGVNVTEPVASLSTSLTASMPLFQGGALRAQRDWAKASLDGAVADRGRTRDTLRWLVADGLLQIAQAEETVVVQEAALEADEGLLATVSLQVQAGSRTPADLHSQEAIVARRRSSVASAAQTLAAAQLTLLTVLRLDPESGWTFEPPAPLVAAGSADELLETAMASRPDLRSADDAVHAALASRRVALSAFLPAVGLGAGASTSWLSSNPDPFFGQLGNQTRAWATLDMSMTLLDAGVRKARMSTADVAVREAELAKERLVDQVSLDVRVLLSQERAARVALDAASSAAQSAQQAADVLALRYQTGAETLISVTQARAAQVEAELERATTEFEVQRIRYQLAWATGDLSG